jgi:hypothetical protein
MSKLSLKFCYLDGSSRTINIKKVTALDMDIKKLCLHLDRIDDDGYLLVVNEKFWNPVEQKLQEIKVIREL